MQNLTALSGRDRNAQEWIRPCVALGILGRAAIVALSRDSISFRPYTELFNKETEVIGVSDHLASELPSLLHYVQSGQLTSLSRRCAWVGFNAALINAALDALDIQRPG